MKNYFNPENHLVGPSIILGICILVFCFTIISSVTRFVNRDSNISVTGSYEQEVKSDMSKWTITVSERAYGEGAGIAASRQAANSAKNIQNYLKKNGFKDEEITIQTVNLSPICELSPQGYENCNVGVRGQIANQNIIVETAAVDKVQAVSGKIAMEISGVNISNNLVEYFFSHLKDVRSDMLKKATANALERAKAVAEAGGASVGSITSVSSGVFQVTQKNSVSVDDYGMYDTTSIDKKITATVKVNFSVR